jgi:hypothetical protein
MSGPDYWPRWVSAIVIGVPIVCIVCFAPFLLLFSAGGKSEEAARKLIDNLPTWVWVVVIGVSVVCFLTALFLVWNEVKTWLQPFALIINGEVPERGVARAPYY